MGWALAEEPAEVQTYEVHKRMTDFPDREDLSTPEAAYFSIHRGCLAQGTSAFIALSVPELAARMRAAEPKSQPLPKEAAEAYRAAEVLEVHVWKKNYACVIARIPRKDHSLDLRFLRSIDGRWLNEGNDGASNLEQAREKIAKQRQFVATQELRDSRPAVANPAAHLEPFVEFLRQEGREPQAFLLEAMAQHRLVILGELHHRPRYWAFDADLVRAPQFAERVGVIYLELPSHDQPAVDRFLAASSYDPQPVIEMLRDNLWTGWPDQAMLDFFRTVWEVNQTLPSAQRLRIVLVDMARPWKEIEKREDWKKYDVDRDQFMAENIVRDLQQTSDPRHALFIVGYGHAMLDLRGADGRPMRSAGWHLRRQLGASEVFAVFPHGPVTTNMGQVSGRLALGLFDTALAALDNRPIAFPLDHGPFGDLLFDADPERLTPDSYGKGYQAFLFLGPIEEEVFSPLIPGFYTDEFVRELDRRWRVMEGRGLLEAGIIRRLDGASFTAMMGETWGQPRRDWSAERLGPLDAWHHGSRYRDALRKRLPSRPATTGTVLELYDIRSGRESLANLAKGTVRAPDLERFRGDGPEGQAWLAQEGIDLIAFASTDVGDQGIAGYGLLAAPIDNDRFDPLDRNEAEAALQKVEPQARRQPASMLSIKAGLPVTYAIRLRDGSLGVLQIEDAQVSQKPAVFRVRYRLFPKP